jgi:ABC-type Na+ transport system ATPase subunit NatA
MKSNHSWHRLFIIYPNLLLAGYCPQFDALLDLLTVREHLNLFALLKGVGDGDQALISAEVQQKIDQLDLNRFADVTANALSGGNRRKLSLAIALLKDPPVILLDGAYVCTMYSVICKARRTALFLVTLQTNRIL